MYHWFFTVFFYIFLFMAKRLNLNWVCKCNLWNLTIKISVVIPSWTFLHNLKARKLNKLEWVYFLLQRIFPTQGLNLDLLHCRQILYCLSHPGSPIIPSWAFLPNLRARKPNNLEQRLANFSLQAESTPVPDFINKVIYWSIYILSCTYCLCCFCATLAELSCWVRGDKAKIFTT